MTVSHQTDRNAVVYGDGTNRCFYTGIDFDGLPRADYFPDLNVAHVGDSNTPLTAMIRHYNRLLAFKLDSAWSISYSAITLTDGSVTAGFCAALRAYLKSREQPWFLLTCFYGTFALGTLYWTLHLLLRQETPQVFYVSDLAWLASYVFLLALTLTLLDAGERQSRTGLCWLAPVFCLPQFLLYVTRGDLLLNVLMCGLTMMLAWCAMRGLVWAKRTENGRLRRFYGTVLAFIALEYALWTASCFWVSDTLTNPYFWFDFLLTLVLLLFLPAVRKAVEA